MAWQIKIHTLNVGQGDGQIIEVWDEVDNQSPKVDQDDFDAWAQTQTPPAKNCNTEDLKRFAQEYKTWKRNNVTPKYQAILIDGGKYVDFITSLKAVCNQHKIKITKVMISHFDDDHFEGLKNVFKNIYLETVIKRVEEFKKIQLPANAKNIENFLMVDYVYKLSKKDNGTFIIYNDKANLEKITVKYTATFDTLYGKKYTHNDVEKFINDFQLDLRNKGIYKGESAIIMLFKASFEVFYESAIDLYRTRTTQDNQLYIDAEDVEFIFTDRPIKLSYKDKKQRFFDYFRFYFKDIQRRDTYKLVPTSYKLGSDILGFISNNTRLVYKGNMGQILQTPTLFIVAALEKIYDIPINHQLQSSTTATNRASIGLLLLHKEFSYLTCGDMEDDDTYQPELQLSQILNTAGYRRLILMKLGHHGSENSSKTETLNNLNPDYVIISCGGKFDHNHPTREVIKRIYENSRIQHAFFTNCAPRYGVKDSWNNYMDSNINIDVICTNAENEIKSLEGFIKSLEKTIERLEKQSNPNQDQITQLENAKKEKQGYENRIKHINEVINKIKLSPVDPNFLLTVNYYIFWQANHYKSEKENELGYIQNILNLTEDETFTVLNNSFTNGQVLVPNNQNLPDKTTVLRQNAFFDIENPRLFDNQQMLTTYNNNGALINLGLGYGSMYENINKKKFIEGLYNANQPRQVDWLAAKTESGIKYDFLKMIPSINSSELEDIYGFNENKPNTFSYSKPNTSNQWKWYLQGFDKLSFVIDSLEATFSEKAGNKIFPFRCYAATAKATLYFNKYNVYIKDISLTLHSDSLTPYWTFKLPEKVEHSANEITIQSLVTLANGNFMPYKIPDSLSRIFGEITSSLGFNRFDGIFYADPKFSSKISLDISIKENWVLIKDKLAIEDMGFDIDLEPNVISTGVYGTFNFKGTGENKKAIIHISMDQEATWDISIHGQPYDNPDNTKIYKKLPNLVDIADTFFDNFPIQSIPFIAEKDESDNPRLDITFVQIRFNFQAEQRIQALAINSTITIKGIKFNILLQIYPTWKIKGYLDTSKPVKVETILTSFGLGEINGIGGIEIRRAELTASSKYFDIDFDLGDVANFNIGESNVILEEVAIGVTSNNSNISGKFNANLIVERSSMPKSGCNDTDYIEDTVFSLSAAYINPKWSFSGSLQGNISLEILTNWIETTFKISLPQWVENLHLTHAGIAFSTDGTYSFDLGLLAPLSDPPSEGTLPTGQEKNLNIILSIKRETDKPLHFDCLVDIAGKQFEGKIDSSQMQGTEIKVTYDDKQDTISLQDICDSIGLGEITIPDGVNAEFNHAELEYHFGSDKAPKLLKISLSNKDKYNITFLATQTKKAGATAFSGWLYGFSIGINQVQIHLDGLPLIGEQLADVGLGVKDIKAVLLSKSITKEEAATPELSDLHLPTGEDITGWGKATLCCNLQVLNETYPVVLTMGVEKEEKAEDKTMLIRMEAGEDGVYTVADEPAKSSAARISWKKIDKKAGPFRLNKIGFAFEEQLLQLHIDVAMMAGPVSIGFNDLWLASPLTTFDATVGLDAVSVSYISNFLKIDGSFRKMHDAENTYAGSAMIGIKKVNIGAMGVYAKKDGQTSMFIYAMMTDPPLGGDPTFYVTGLALGFGYNRDLVLPDVNQVKQYPLITPFIKGRSADPNKEISETDLPSVALNKLITQGIVPVEIGEQWIAAGVRFTTYKLINSFGLLSVKFGNRLEIGLTALSVIATPTTNNPLVYAELAIDARILPDEGLVAVNAKLTAESFIFEKDCKITGGFALYTWFGDNPNAGDFVVTLGGYHPRFNVPAHYPQVPRLGFNWQVTESLTLKGDLYYALTSSCIMAGGRLEARYESGKLKAWFIIGADFILSWKPYYYEADMYLSFGVSYRLGGETIGKTISASFSAQLRIWGPDFSGVAEIDLFVISVTVRFGEADQGSKPITWKEFKGSFLPPLCAGKTENTPENYTDSYLKVAMVSGIKIEQATSEEKPAKDIKLLQHNIVFETTTIIPAKQISAGNYADKYDKQVTIGMTGNKSLSTSDLTITMTKEGTPYTIRKKPNETGNPEERQYFEITPIRSNLSAALWDKKVEDISAAKDTVVRDLLTGIRFEAKVKNPDEGFSIEKWKLMFAHGTPFEVKLPKQTKVFDTSKVADLRNLTEDSTLRNEMLDAFKLNGLVEKNAVVDFSSRVAYVLKGKPKAEAMW